MIEIPNTLAPLLVQALRDAVTYNEKLLASDILSNRDDYEQYFVDLTQLFSQIKHDYKKIENEAGITLEELLRE
ncbi:MAG: hypothetical protein WED00_02770 [Aquisalimonadaceae bacterium]